MLDGSNIHRKPLFEYYYSGSDSFYQPRKAREPAGPKIALRFPCLFVCLSVHPHLSRAQYYVMRYYATVVYYCTNRFWRFVGQDTEGKCRFLLPRW